MPSAEPTNPPLDKDAISVPYCINEAEVIKTDAEVESSDFEIPFASDEDTELPYWQLPSEQGAVFTDAFTSLDVDADGFLSRDELLPEFPPAEIDSALGGANGQMDLAEFTSWRQAGMPGASCPAGD